jgi:hypothetical protein
VVNAIHEQVTWLSRDNTAELIGGLLAGRIDTARPNAGLQCLALHNEKKPAGLLSIYRADVANEKPWPLSVAESYVRGNDLVASYQSSDSWPFSPQLYWRANSLRKVDGVLASISLLVSVQTHLLDTVPQIAVSSALNCDELLLLPLNRGSGPIVEQIEPSKKTISATTDCCIVFRLRDAPLSYVEIMPTGDFHDVRVHETPGGSALEWRLFAEFLEKGVIRRARLHAAVLARENDVENAAACCAAIHNLELPLTA